MKRRKENTNDKLNVKTEKLNKQKRQLSEKINSCSLSYRKWGALFVVT